MHLTFETASRIDPYCAIGYNFGVGVLDSGFSTVVERRAVTSAVAICTRFRRTEFGALFILCWIE